jgi:hypothetical protein
MTYQTPIRLRKAANCQPCSVPRCTRPRHGLSLFCRSHKDANRSHGHPLGRRIFPREYAVERKEVAALLRTHPNHPGVERALSWLHSMLARGLANDPKLAGRAEYARVARAGVTPAQILEELASVRMFAHRYPRTLPDDARLDFAFSTAVLRLAPRAVERQYSEASKRKKYAVAPKDERRAIGKAIRKELGLLFYTIATEPERALAARDAGRRAQLMPFNPTLHLMIPHPTTV